jgi:hypothetical protein
MNIWIDEDFEDGAVMELGITPQNESQRITVSGGIVTGGSFTLSYNGFPFTVNHDSDLAVWAASFQAAIDALEDGDDNLVFNTATVIAQNAGSGVVIFDVSFSGLDAKRNFEKFQVVSNSLVSTSTITLFISTTLEGSPVNTVAPEINVETTPPGGVLFSTATFQSPITIPLLNPDEGFPLWIKRTIAAGTEAKERDGFVLAYSAESLQP